MQPVVHWAVIGAIPAAVAVKITSASPFASVFTVVAGAKVPDPDVSVKVMSAPSTTLPSISFKVAVIMDCSPTAMEVGAALIVNTLSEVKVTVVEAVVKTVLSPIVAFAVTSADPGVVPEISDTVTTPVSSGVVALDVDSVPRLFVNATAVPF